MNKFRGKSYEGRERGIAVRYQKVASDGLNMHQCCCCASQGDKRDVWQRYTPRKQNQEPCCCLFLCACFDLFPRPRGQVTAIQHPDLMCRGYHSVPNTPTRIQTPRYSIDHLIEYRVPHKENIPMAIKHTTHRRPHPVIVLKRPFTTGGCYLVWNTAVPAPRKCLFKLLVAPRGGGTREKKRKPTAVSLCSPA